MGLELSNCCFCIELRTGSLIIGYLSLVGNIILTIMSIAGLVLSSTMMNQGDDDRLKVAGGVALAVFCILLIIVLLNLIFTIVLLVGLHNYKRGHVKAYLIFTGIFIVFSIIMFIASLSTSAAAGTIVRDLLTILASIYFMLVIRSYYLKMDDPDKRPTVYNTA